MVLALAAYTVFYSTPFVHAIGYGGFGGRPAYPRADNPRTDSIFVHTLNPGAVQDEGVLVINNSAEPKTILVNATDSTPSTDGAFACAQVSEEALDVGSWIVLEKNEVTLSPGVSELVPFTISVPNSAGVGEHNGCIVMQEKKEPSTAEGGGISLSFRTGLRVSVTIPGEIQRSLSIDSFSLGKGENGSFTTISAIKNNGNVSIDADVKIETRHAFGLLQSVQGGQYPVLRGELATYHLDIAKPFWGGWYRTKLLVSYDANDGAGVGVLTGKTLTFLQSDPVWFFSFPTTPGLLVEIVVVLLLLMSLWKMIAIWRRNVWITTRWVLYTVQVGDDVQTLAQRYRVSWKLLVKANHLKPPYTLHPGQAIKIPPSL